MKIEINDQEFDVILAALRQWEVTLESDAAIDQMILDIATNGDTHQLMPIEQINELCMSLNTGQRDRDEPRGDQAVGALYLVVADSAGGDNLDMFAAAGSAAEAYELWHDEWPDDDVPARIFAVSTVAADARGIIPWGEPQRFGPSDERE